MKSLRFRLLLLCSLALLGPGCHVYDENLLDGAYADIQDVQIQPDVVDDDAGMIDDDVPIIEEDVVVDTGPDCIGLVSDGAACIAPYAGQNASPDDLRMPGPTGLLVTLRQQILVGDIGTGRVIAFPTPGSDGGTGSRLIGTGIQGTPRPAPMGMPDAGTDAGAMEASVEAGMEAGATDGGSSDARTDARTDGSSMDGARDGSADGAMMGDAARDSGPPPVTARTQSLIAPAAMELLPNGDIVVADSASHLLYVYEQATDRVVPFGTHVFTYGPVALRRLDADNLLISADNQIYEMTITGSMPGGLTSIIGQSCGMTCRGFTAATTAGVDAQVNLPTGIDFDDNFIYFADSMNCRVRRASRTSGNFQIDTLAGSGCNRDADLSGASSGTLLALNAPLGPVSDVKVGAGGFVFLTDAVWRCSIYAVNLADGKLSSIAGRTDGCSITNADNHGAVLGQLGQLAFAPNSTPPLSQLYYVDRTYEKVGLINVANPSAPGAPTFPVNPGIIPVMDEDPATVRTGGVSGIAAMSDNSGNVFWGDLAARRVYLGSPNPANPPGPPLTNTVEGVGVTVLTQPLASRNIEPFEPIGLADIPDMNGDRLFVGMPDHDVIAEQFNAPPSFSINRVVGTYDTPPPPSQMDTPMFMGGAAMDTVLAPQWPATAGNAQTDLLFTTDAPGRVMFVVGAGSPAGSGANHITLIAGPAAGQTGNIVTQTGSIDALTARLGHPAGVASNSRASGTGAGDYYVAATGDHCVYRITPQGQLSVLAGIVTQTTPLNDTMKPANQTAILAPMGVAYDADRNHLYVADADANRIRMIDLNANPPTMITLAGHDPVDPFDLTPTGDYGPASQAVIAHPVALQYSSNLLYVGEGYSGRVRIIHLP